MQLPEVSVIIPTYNYGHLIEETLLSISNQSYKNWECIVVDNQSTDNTEQIVLNWTKSDKRFKYLKIQHSTTSGCRNSGVKISKGDFIQFVDADDQIAEDKLKNQIELFRQNSNASIVYSNAMYYDHGNNKSLRFTIDNSNEPWMVEFTGYSLDLLPRMLKRNVFVISSPLLKRSVFEETKGFFEPLNWVEDWEFYFRCFVQNYYIVFDSCQNSASHIRVHNNSLSRNKIRMCEQALLARNRISKMLNGIKNYSRKLELCESNNKEQIYLYKTLAKEYAINSPLISKKYLINFALKSKDFKFFCKVIASFIFKKVKIEIPE